MRWDEKERIRSATVAWVNRLREEAGEPVLRDLLPGHRGEADGCPVANSIPGCFDAGQLIVSGERDGAYFEAETPGYVDDFMLAFDRGAFPELELPPEPTPPERRRFRSAQGVR